MNNFIFQNPTKLIFGKGMISKLGCEIPSDSKVLITFGGGSVKTNGVYDQVVAALKGHDYLEFWGIEPNPRVETLRKAVDVCKEENISFLLSVGGGSVLDGTKLIAAAACADEDAWSLVLKGSWCGKMIPIASVMTLPATASEMNSGAVISNEATGEKFAFYSQYPKFSILDPETTYSLPEYQVAVGVADTFVHVMEQYLTTTGQSPLMDRWAEGILHTLVETAPKLIGKKPEYNSRADFMLCATMALNDFVRMGVTQDWATHMIGHELTALEGITHGNTLVIILPSLMNVLRDQKKDKILQYGERIWGIKKGSEQERIDKTIEATEKFFRSLGLKTRLREMNVGDETILEIERRFTGRGAAFGEGHNVDGKMARRILEGAN